MTGIPVCGTSDGDERRRGGRALRRPSTGVLFLDPQGPKGVGHDCHSPIWKH